MRNLILTSLCLFVMFLAVPTAVATVKTGNFQLELITETSISSSVSLNNGYQSTWFNYPQNSPPWWNEWWYDDPFLQPGGKWIQVTFDYQLLNPLAPGDVHITINWTNAGWVDETKPPTWDNSPNPELYIERLSDPEYNVNQDAWTFHLEPNPQNPLFTWNSGKYWLPIDYNPVWVSVDVQGMGNVGISNGVLLHECVPEPTTIVLLGLGGLLLRRCKL